MSFITPEFVIPGEASSDQHNLQVVDNLLYLKDQDDARGFVGRHVLTSNSVGYTATGNSDLTTTVDLLAERDYLIHAYINATLSAAGRWYFSAMVDGVKVDRMHDTQDVGVLGGGQLCTILYQPLVDHVAAVVRLYHTEVSGTSTMTYAGSSGAPRYLAVEDIGPRRS